MTAQTHQLPASTPAISIADMQRRLAVELSTRARLGYVTLLLTALGMGTVAVSLWLGEPDLPTRTQFAFGLMTIIAACWAVFAMWTLTRRRVLLGFQDLIAARMGVVFSSVFLVLFLVLSFSGAVGRSSAAIALPLAGAMVVAALTLLVRARHRITRLRDRCRALEQQIAHTPASEAARR